MPSLASLSMRGVGIVPPYTPKFPQPTLSTKMNTTLGFFSCANVGKAANIVAPTNAQPRASRFLPGFTGIPPGRTASISILIGVYFRLGRWLPLAVVNQVVYRWNDFVIRVAEFIAPRGEIFVAHLIDSNLERCADKRCDDLAVHDGVSRRQALVGCLCEVAEIAR